MGSLFHLLCFWLLGVIVFFFLRKKLLPFYILFELRLIPTLLMVFFFGYQPEKLQASMYLLIYTVFSSLPLLLIFLRLGGYILFFPQGGVFWFVLFITLGWGTQFYINTYFDFLVIQKFIFLFCPGLVLSHILSLGREERRKHLVY